MNDHTKRRRPLRPTPSRGFTLIEVMVTLALTLIMMSLFAQIFQKTGDFVTRQKGIGENDQSARIVTTVLKTDLQARTMRYLAPFHPNMQAMPDDPKRQGYFYYSENNPMDDTDDVIQFTIGLTNANLPTTNPNSNGQVNGLATNLPLPWQPNTVYAAGAYVRPAGSTGNASPTGYVYQTTAGLTSGGTEPNWSNATGPPNPPPLLPGQTVTDGTGTWTAIASAIDQPDGDDGVMSYLSSSGLETVNPPNVAPNNAGASQYAEVAYFLRHGNLYRRVLLIRNPYNNSISAPSSQPLTTTGASLIPGTYPPTTGYANTFWGDFDYAARALPVTGGGTGVAFLGTTSNENSLANINPGTYPIGRPDNRFGFDQVYNTPAVGTQTVNGAPREYALSFNSAANSYNGTPPTPVFFGRYTDEETSNTNFLFPGNLPQVGGVATSPMGWNSVLGLDSTNYTMWLLNGTPPTPPPAKTPFSTGSRRGEDILLTNVVSFDVKIWDNHYSEVTTTGTQFDWNRNGIIDSGPAFADVGHLAASGDFQQANNIFPVYGPNVETPYAVPGAGVWAPTYTYPSNGANLNYNNVFDTWFRYYNYDNLPRTYDSADTASLYAPPPYRARLGNPWAAGHVYNVNDVVYSSADSANGNVYQCTANTATMMSGATEPFLLSDAVNSTIADGNVTWTVESPAAVQAIQITVKYLDPTQNLLRQVTIVQSLTY
jgi:prepilin-type N-terminal cleavage/methylation domain-containing protein